MTLCIKLWISTTIEWKQKLFHTQSIRVQDEKFYRNKKKNTHTHFFSTFVKNVRSQMVQNNFTKIFMIMRNVFTNVTTQNMSEHNELCTKNVNFMLNFIQILWSCFRFNEIFTTLPLDSDVYIASRVELKKVRLFVRSNHLELSRIDYYS